MTWQTASDLLNHKFSEEEETQFNREEAAFRRGYFNAISDSIDAFQSGMDPRQLHTYINRELWNWYFNNCDEIVDPPEMPEPWSKIRLRILERDDYICAYCGCKNAKTVDHKQPVTRDGTDDDENLVACCRSCNSKKGQNNYHEYMNKIGRWTDEEFDLFCWSGETPCIKP